MSGGRAADLPGAAHLTLAGGVVHLDPATAVFEAMLEGWQRQRQTRFLKWESTVKPQLSLVRRFAVFTGLRRQEMTGLDLADLRRRC